MFELAVIICTHNPNAAFIQRAVAGLQSQDLPKERWELLLIDNASLSPVHKLVALDWHPNARFIIEPQLGLTHARLRGIRETSAELLVFVDDDNVLAPDYLRKALEISMEFSQMGAFGGRCLPEFMEGPPPAWTKHYWNCLGIWEFEQDVWSSRNDKECIPCGAGLVARRKVVDFYRSVCDGDTRRVALDRLGQSLMSGGDYDLALCATDLGLGIGKFHRLKLHHLMPSSRFQEQYLLRLWRAVHCSGKVMSYLRSGRHSKFNRSPRQQLRRFIRLVMGGKRDVHFRFGLAAEDGLRDADNIISSFEKTHSGKAYFCPK